MNSYIPSNPSMPKQGSRARRVLDALFSFPPGPVDEGALMARHYLNNCSASNWRKDTYRKLQDAFLITLQDGGLDGPASWTLTNKGRLLMGAAACAAAGATDPAPDCAGVIAPSIVQPRTLRPFHPMVQVLLAIRETRPGALDYQSIPSMMGGKRCA